jgi:alpha/beta superfamily hydrolase
MPERRISFKSNGLELEGCLSLPETSHPIPGAVLCHPHPLNGGSMDNNVILAVSRALAARNIAALRFNFRGVGRSQGSYDGGVGEKDDALAALAFLADRDEIDSSRLGLVGYSFGGMVALSSGIQNDLVKAVAGISPVLPRGILEKVLKPLIIIYGTEDEIVPPSTIIKETAGLEQGSVQAVEGVDHFWWGYEAKAAEIVADFLIKNLI